MATAMRPMVRAATAMVVTATAPAMLTVATPDGATARRPN
jgi:hypothetical protein